MDRLKTARNVAIVLAIAAAVFLLPGGGRAASTFEAVLLIGFGVGFAYLGLRLYREHRVAIHGLGDRNRTMLYGALALVVLVVIGQKRMWQTSIGAVLWFALIVLAVYALANVYRHWRTY
jgi:phosphatidylglycerophosphate synthase